MTTQPKALKISRWVWAAIMLFMLGFISVEARAEDSLKTQYMIYDVYASGFHVVQANLTVDRSKKDRFNIKMDASTFGFLGKLAPWEGKYESYGWVTGDKIMPERHQSTATWRDEEETHTYDYLKSGKFKTYRIKEHNKAEYVKEAEEELTLNTADVLTATFRAMDAVAKENVCNHESIVFDGKRRFKQIFKDKGEKTLEASKYNIFSGSARECTVEVVPDGGRWHDKPRGWLSIQEQGRERGTMPTVWMANVSEKAPAVPVKVRVKTAYGTLFMHLSEYRYGDQMVVAEKRGG